MAKKNRDSEKKKRSFFQSLFEPAVESETDGFFDEPDFQDEPELVHLFDDDEVIYSDEQDQAALDALTWDDGALVVDELPVRDGWAEESHAGRASRGERGRIGSARHSGMHRVQRMAFHFEEEEPIEQPVEAPAEEKPRGTMDASAFLKRSAEPAREHKPLTAEPIAPVEAEPIIEESPVEEPVETTSGPIAAVTMDAAAFLARGAEPAREQAAELVDESEVPLDDAFESTFDAIEEPTLEAEESDAPKEVRMDAAAFLARNAAASREEMEQPTEEVTEAEAIEEGSSAEEAPIRLFDDEEADEPVQLFDGEADDTPIERDVGPRSRIVRTGKGTAARIQMNATETYRSMEEAKRRQRETAAAKQHEQYVERQKRQARRKRAVKRMASNIAFVSFLVIAVLVALYYTFLLKDIVVVGNETYDANYIKDLSKLQLGTHMLICDLDEAQRNIETDPYLQVNAVDYIFPARIRINVTERKEVAGIIGLDYNVIIDHSGYVLSMGGGTDLSDLLQVTGVSMTGFQVGQRLGQSDDFGTATLVTMIEELETYMLIDDIAALDLTTPLAITMQAKNGLKIHVGQPTDLDAKMLSLRNLLPQFVSSDVSTGTLYLSARGGTVYSPPNTGAVVPDVIDPNAINPFNPGELPTEGDPQATPNPYLQQDPSAILPGTTPTPATPTPLLPGGGDAFSG